MLVTMALREVEFYSFTWQNPRRNQTNLAPRLQKPQVTINHKEVETREHNASIGNANMKDEEDYEEDVEVMSVIEQLKDFSPNAGNGCNP